MEDDEVAAEIECLQSMYPGGALVLDTPRSGTLMVEFEQRPSIQVHFQLCVDGTPDCAAHLSCDDLSREQVTKLNEWAACTLTAGSEMQLLSLVAALSEVFEFLPELIDAGAQQAEPAPQFCRAWLCRKPSTQSQLRR
jgi:hypothetical protein